jgi:hypothetical protein
MSDGKKTASMPFFYLEVFASQKLQLKHYYSGIHAAKEASL